MEPRPIVLTVREAAAILRVSDDSLYEALRRGEVPGAFRILQQWRIPFAALSGVGWPTRAGGNGKEAVPARKESAARIERAAPA